jgi:hypothetical protein
MSLRPSVVAGLIIGGVGALLLVAGGVLRSIDPDAEFKRVDALPLVTAASWKTLAPGTTVLVEGRIPASMPAGFRNFVACDHFRYAGQETSGTSKGREKWTLVEHLAPALTLERTDGPIALSGGYQLPAPCYQWEGEDVVTRALDTRSEKADGLRAGDMVVAEARVTAQGLETALVRCGMREDYLQQTQENAAVPGLLGLLFFAIGGLLAVVAGAVVWLGRRG